MSRKTSKGLLRIILLLFKACVLITGCLAESHSLGPREVEYKPKNDLFQQFLPIDSTAKTALNYLIRSAIARNPEIQSMEQRVAQTRGLYQQSSLRPNPALDIEMGTDVEAAKVADRGVSVGYSHVFEMGEKRQRRMNLTQEEITIAQYQLAERTRNVAGQLRRDFLQALVLSRMMADQQELAKVTMSLVDVVDQRVQQGETAAIELNQARVEHSRVTAALGLLQGRRRALLEAIRTLAGFDAGTSVRVEGEIEPRKTTLSINELVVRALDLRPDLNAARSELNKTEAEIDLLEAQRAPNITGFLRYSYSRSAFDIYGLDAQGNLAPIRDLDHALSAGITFDLPVRDRNQGNLAAAAAQVQSIRSQVRALEASIRQQVTVAYERYKAGLSSHTIFQDEILEQARASLSTLRETYLLGEVSFSEVLNEQRRLSELQRAYNDVLFEITGAAADLAQASAAPVP